MHTSGAQLLPSQLLTREVLTRGPMSRTELARRLGLSRASLTRLSKPLLEDGLFVEAATAREERTGRPVRPLDVAATQRHFIGVNLTGHDLTAVVTTMRAQVVASEHRALTGTRPADVVQCVGDVVTDLRAGCGSVLGVGVSLGGHVRDHQIVTRAPFLGWSSDVALGSMLAEATGLTTVVDNDLLALTRAEHWFGAANDTDLFAVLTIGAGVGSGLVVHDRVVESADAGIGLVGHFPLEPSGPTCSEGHHGCAQMLTIPSIRSRASVALGRDVTYEQFLDLARDGNRAAAAISSQVGLALGRLIAATANLTLAHRIILTGEGVGIATLVREQVDEGIRRDRDPLATKLEIEIQPSDFTEWARGAAALAIQSHVLHLA